MAHYALLDENNVVTWVITGNDEDFVHEGVESWEDYYGTFHNQKCLRTSYNTHAGIHSGGGEPFRGNFAGIGFTYNEDLDAFIPPRPGDSWVFDEATFSWIEVTE
jgi:hypothetical protein